MAQANIAVPLLLGEMLAFAITGHLDLTLLIVAHVFGILDQLFIVWSNDVADEESDRANEHPTFLSGGSRVLTDGKLTRRQLARGAAAAALLLLALCIFAAVQLDRPAMPLAWALAVLLAWAYSFPPARLAYRGYGAIAQAFGVMVALPLIGFYLQAGSVDAFPWKALIPCIALGLAGNITTALPDHEADEATNKSTWPVRYGAERARKHSLQFIALGALCAPLVLPDLPQMGWALVEAGPLLLLALNLRIQAKANAGNRKAILHFSIINGAAINLAITGWIIALALRPPSGWAFY